MKEKDIKHIWHTHSERDLSDPTYTLEDIQAYRKKKSAQTSRSSRWTILFDILVKIAIVIGLCYILFFQSQYPWSLIIGMIMAFTTGLILIEFSFLQKLKQIKNTDTVIENLKHNLHYMRTKYAWFISLSALTSPLFVLCGFFLYYHFKYGEIQMRSPLVDPIPYLFLLLAFTISYFSQMPLYKNQVRELQESIEDMDDTRMASVKIEAAKKKRNRHLIIFSIVVLIGILLFLIILMR